MTQSAPSVRFRTDALPVADRFPWWREEVSRRHIKFDIEARDPDNFFGSIEMMQLPIGNVIRMHCDAAVCTRTPALARQGSDEFMFGMIEAGGYRIEGPRNAIDLNQGDAMLAFNGTQCTVEVRGTDHTLIQLDAATLRHALRDIDDRLLQYLPAGNQALRLLVNYIQAMMREGAPADPALANLVNTHIVDLIAVGLRPDGSTMERAMGGALPAARFSAVRADILAHLSEIRLTAKEIARRQGLSERYIYLLFEQNGMSLSSFITDERLKRAMTMLVDPACDPMRISAIAYAAGFADLTTFNRGFRRRFGRTPSEMRDDARRERKPMR